MSENAKAFVFILLAVALFTGEPSLLDAVTNYINRAGCQP